MKNFKQEVDKEILYRIEMLYDKCIWLAKDDNQIDVLEIDDLYFNTILKSMRNKYGVRFNLWEKEQRLRRVRKEYRDSHFGGQNLNLHKYNKPLDSCKIANY